MSRKKLMADLIQKKFFLTFLAFFRTKKIFFQGLRYFKADIYFLKIHSKNFMTNFFRLNFVKLNHLYQNESSKSSINLRNEFHTGWWLKNSHGWKLLIAISFLGTCFFFSKSHKEVVERDFFYFFFACPI